MTILRDYNEVIKQKSTTRSVFSSARASSCAVRGRGTAISRGRTRLPPSGIRGRASRERRAAFRFSGHLFGARDSREASQGRTEDALASAGDEGRGKLRKCPGTRKRGLIRTCPNGATHAARAAYRHSCRGLPGELKHLSTRRRRKKQSIPPVVAIERGSSPNRAALGPRGVVGPDACCKIREPEACWKAAA